MSVQTLLQRFFPFEELKATICRFPLPVLCSTALFIIGILSVHRFIDDHEEITRIFYFLVCAYLWGVISTLYGERVKWGFAEKFLLFFVGTCVIGALMMQNLWWIYFSFFVPALLLFLMVAPYVRQGDDLSFYFFNSKMWLGIFEFCVVLFLFLCATGLILDSVSIFPQYFSGAFYFFLALFLTCLLLWIPKNFDYSDDKNSFLIDELTANRIFSTAMFLGLFWICIIYVGSFFSMLDSSTYDMPSSLGAYEIMLLYGGVTIAQVCGTHQTRLSNSMFFLAWLISVIVLLFLSRAFYYHISLVNYHTLPVGAAAVQYSVPFICGIWLIILTVGRKFFKIPIRYIPLSFGLLLVLAAFGLTGYINIDGKIKYDRLEVLLIKNDMLVNGVVVETDERKLPDADRSEIAGLYNYLCQTGQSERMAAWHKPYLRFPRDKWTCTYGMRPVFQPVLELNCGSVGGGL